MRWAVILAGGSGSRFWPLSTPTMPKQLLPLAGDLSTAEQAVLRLEGLIPRERLLVVRVRDEPRDERFDLPGIHGRGRR